jgi:hypothetical protein
LVAHGQGFSHQAILGVRQNLVREAVLIENDLALINNKLNK